MQTSSEKEARHTADVPAPIETHAQFPAASAARLTVYAADRSTVPQARQLSNRLHAVFSEEKPPRDSDAVTLCFGEDGLSLQSGEQTLRGDFLRMLPRIRTNSIGGELLVKAARGKKPVASPTAVDATAGLGEDSFLLAAAGFTVCLFESDPVIAALLRDALSRAEKEPELQEIVKRMQLTEADSIAAMPSLPEPPDLILLDPMFPKRQKSALVKKKFQLLHLLERPCSDEEALIRAAMAAHPRRIVIKRPLKGPFLAGIKPSYSLSGKAIRYDCLILPEQQKP